MEVFTYESESLESLTSIDLGESVWNTGVELWVSLKRDNKHSISLSNQ